MNARDSASVADTHAALRLLEWFELAPTQLLDRHVTGDWGVIDAGDSTEP